jgi:hypothetical protein
MSSDWDDRLDYRTSIGLAILWQGRRRRLSVMTTKSNHMMLGNASALEGGRQPSFRLANPFSAQVEAID